MVLANHVKDMPDMFMELSNCTIVERISVKNSTYSNYIYIYIYNLGSSDF